MAENAVQVSQKKPDGTIYVIGGDDFDKFVQNALALFEGDQGVLDTLLKDMVSTLMPISGGGQVQQQGFYGGGQPQPQSSYAPPSGMRIAQQPVYFESPFSDKEAVRAAGGKWDKDRKSWYAPPGADLTQFTRWLPPGV